MWRDNLDENGAAIRMRAGSRDNMMIALSLGLCKPHLRCRSAIALCQSRPGGASCRSSHVRNAPKATAGRQNVARRDGPQAGETAAGEPDGDVSVYEPGSFRWRWEEARDRPVRLEQF